MALHHQSIEVWVLAPRQAGRVLLLKKSAVAGRHAAFWQPVTGGIQVGETPMEAAARELREETGFEHCPLVDLQATVTCCPVDKVLVRHLFAAVCRQEDPSLDDNEHEAWQWVAVDEVADQLGQDSSARGWQVVRGKLGLIYSQARRQ